VVRSRFTVLALLMSAVLVAGIGWVASAHPLANSALVATAQRVHSQIVASFRAFRRPSTRADALPTRLSSFGVCGGEGPGGYAWCDVDHPQPPGQADAANGWRLAIFGKVHQLLVADSRRVSLPDGLGAIWLIPSGHWLCAVQNGPQFRNY
jgi:hypothetical protein